MLIDKQNDMQIDKKIDMQIYSNRQIYVNNQRLISTFNTNFEKRKDSKNRYADR